MPLYDYRCPQGHRFERLAAIEFGASQPCPACGESSTKLPSSFAIGGRADPGLAMEQMPQTWRGTYHGNREYVGQLQRQWEQRQKLEDKHEELRGDRRPIIAHEGRFHDNPLRAGERPGGHQHSHTHPHPHHEEGS
jgi:putative FmdB family regulatory protein